MQMGPRSGASRSISGARRGSQGGGGLTPEDHLRWDEWSSVVKKAKIGGYGELYKGAVDKENMPAG
jgi:hypothetical protein